MFILNTGKSIVEFLVRDLNMYIATKYVSIFLKGARRIKIVSAELMNLDSTSAGDTHTKTQWQFIRRLLTEEIEISKSLSA